MGHKPDRRARKKRREREADLRSRIKAASAEARRLYRLLARRALRETRKTGVGRNVRITLDSCMIASEKPLSVYLEAANLLQHPAHGGCDVSVEVREEEHGLRQLVTLIGQYRQIT